MRVEFHQHDSDYEASAAVRAAVEAHLMSKIFHGGHPTKTFRCAIDGVPTFSGAGFPQLEGWKTALLEILHGFVAFRMSLMHTVLDLTIEHNGYQPLSLGGSFFIRVRPDEDLFLEVNFREELDGSCADPMEIFGFCGPEDFTLARTLMAGQRTLSVEESKFEDSTCNHMSARLADALRKQQGHYKWMKGEGVLAGRELRPELPLRAARLELAMAEEGFRFSHGTLGPTLRHLAEQYLV